MKNMLYKEFKTICKMYWFVLLSAPFFVLFKNDFSGAYTVVMLFFCSSYNWVFNGSTEGFSNNDLYYSFLLPVKKKDIVLSKIMFCGISQVIYTAMILIFVFLSEKFANLLYKESEDIPVLSILCMYFVSYTIFDLMFFSIYYKKPGSCISAIISGALPAVTFVYWVTEHLFSDMSVVTKLIIVFTTIVICFVGHYLTLKIATDNLKKINL